MVASSHAELDLTEAVPRVRNLARNCFSFVRRKANGTAPWISLSRVEQPTGAVQAQVEAGDELYIGNCILRVDGPTAVVDCLPAEAPPTVPFSRTDEVPAATQELAQPPLPALLPVPSVPQRFASSEALLPPPLPDSHRQRRLDGASVTWTEALSLEEKATAPTTAPLAPVVDPPISARPLSEVPTDSQGLFAEMSAPDDPWSPPEGDPVDPTELPLPRFLQKKGPD